MKILRLKSKLILRLRTYALAVFFGFILLPSVNPAYCEDMIIAIVNNEIITQKDLDEFLNFMRVQLSQELKDDEIESKIESMKLDLLNRLIDDRLILQEAKRKNINVDQHKIDARMDEIKRRYGSELKFQQTITQQGLTQADIETKIKEQFLMYGIVDSEVRSKIIIKPTEVTEFYEKNKNKMKTPERREITSINVGENQKQANRVFYELKGGSDLNELSRQYGLQVTRLSVSRGAELRKDIEGAVFSLDKGEISKPVSINDKFYLFRIENIIAPRQQSLSEAQEDIYSFLFEQKMQNRLMEWLYLLKEKSYIKIL